MGEGQLNAVEPLPFRRKCAAAELSAGENSARSAEAMRQNRTQICRVGQFRPDIELVTSSTGWG